MVVGASVLGVDRMWLGSEGKQSLSGMILFDGEPLKAGTISFAPEQGKGRPGSAMFSDGHYNLEAEKGLAPGRYVVKIFANAIETGRSVT